MFDVLVYNDKTMTNSVYRNGIPKSEAKKTVKELKKNGFKAQLVTSKGEKETVSLSIPEVEND